MVSVALEETGFNLICSRCDHVSSSNPLNMNAVKDAVSGTGYNVYSFADVQAAWQLQMHIRNFTPNRRTFMVR